MYSPKYIFSSWRGDRTANPKTIPSEDRPSASDADRRDANEEGGTPCSEMASIASQMGSYSQGSSFTGKRFPSDLCTIPAYTELAVQCEEQINRPVYHCGAGSMPREHRALWDYKRLGPRQVETG